ncbi:MAG: GNAT family N-acetyltransferase [Caldithrix sp.]|nr:GNAT family N-acetyltransferase [Caldithrix sp.]
MLYRICLQTGDSGGDATPWFTDPDLLGHYYAAPYAILEPDLCFVATADGTPCGYILGTRDTRLFAERCEWEWFPVLRQRYPKSLNDDENRDKRIIDLIHQGIEVKEALSDYPAHLHIDLLPLAQGRGMGRKLMNRFINQLKELKIPALHLEVGKKNSGAIKFYERVGFIRIKEFEHSMAFGQILNT